MARIVAIVEGHGEVEAVPILLRRIAALEFPDLELEVPKPVRTKRQRLLKEGELERTIELAARLGGPEGRILVLLDADDDCPRDLGPCILERATLVRSDRRIGVVLATTEYEAWFLAAASSLAGHRGLAVDLAGPREPEKVQDAKSWLSLRMPRGSPYVETLHQPSLTAVFDLEAARQRSPSFDKLWREVVTLLR